MDLTDVPTEELVAELKRRDFDFLQAGYDIEVAHLLSLGVFHDDEPVVDGTDPTNGTS